MTGNQANGGLAPRVQDAEFPVIDVTKAHIARVYDFMLGGKDNFAVDREAARQVIAAYPAIRVIARTQRAFLGRVVRHLAAEAGIRQFLDVGTGLPSADNTHEVAQRVAPESRIVYVDNDPMVLVHARALLVGSREGATSYVHADLRDTSEILREAARTLDFGQPVAVMLLGILHNIADEDDPLGLVAKLMAAVPAGSYLVLSHLARDIAAEHVGEAAERYNKLAVSPVTFRTHAEVSRFFEGLELLEPGVVQLHRWRADPADLALGHGDLANYGAVGRKP